MVADRASLFPNSRNAEDAEETERLWACPRYQVDISGATRDATHPKTHAVLPFLSS